MIELWNLLFFDFSNETEFKSFLGDVFSKNIKINDLILIIEIKPFQKCLFLDKYTNSNLLLEFLMID